MSINPSRSVASLGLKIACILYLLSKQPGESLRNNETDIYLAGADSVNVASAFSVRVSVSKSSGDVMLPAGDAHCLLTHLLKGAAQRHLQRFESAVMTSCRRTSRFCDSECSRVSENDTCVTPNGIQPY
ncbi:uncharacterized [Tachysurus ichikawai]